MSPLIKQKSVSVQTLSLSKKFLKADRAAAILEVPIDKQ